MRLQGWEARLDALIDDARLRPFSWGVHDCCTFAADAVEVLIGIDPMAEFRGLYSGSREAMALAPDGLGVAIGAALSIAGAQQVPAGYAQRGDVVHLSPLRLGPRLGVVYGDAVLVPSQAGLVPVPLNKRLRAWHV